MISFHTEGEVKEFSRMLELPPIKINSAQYEMLPLCEMGISISFSKFMALEQRMWVAAQNLVKAFKTDHKGLCNSETDYSESFWERTMYIENAIISYNACLDYIYIILYFYYDFYRESEIPIKRAKDIDRISEGFELEQKKRLTQTLRKDSQTKKMIEDIEIYRKSSQKLRNNANNLKHRAGFWVCGFDYPRNTKVTKVINGAEVDITMILTPKSHDLEKEIKYLVGIHNQLIRLVLELFYLLNYPRKIEQFLQFNGLNAD